MDGGRRRSRISINAFEDTLPDLSSDEVEEVDASVRAADDEDGGSASSANLVRGWGLE